MNDVDRLLLDAGERWRAGQRTPPDIDVSAFAAGVRRSGPKRLLMIGATAAVLATILSVAWQMWPGSEVGRRGPITPSLQPSGSNAIASDPPACKVTEPIPALVPPAPTLPSPPAAYESVWFGSAALWTMIGRDGEVWQQSSLPHGPGGIGQKTFWWSADWSPDAELAPAITVTGTRLDGSGNFAAGPGTNASADFGTAMLVGVEFPSPGCWQLIARYRDAELAYVVWITED